MRVIGALILLFPLLSFPLVFNKKEKLSPTNLFSIIYFFTIVIPCLVYADTSNTETIQNGYLRTAVESDGIYLKYSILQTISYYFVVLGTSLHFKKGIITIDNPQKTHLTESHSPSLSQNTSFRFFGFCFTIVGFIVFLLIMNSVGGIYYFFTHLQFRSSMIHDLDILTWLLPFLQFGPLMLVYSLKGTNKKLSLGLIVLIVFAGFCAGLGGRKSLVLLLFETLVIYHYCVNRISIKEYIRPKNIVLFIFVGFFFFAFVQFRTEGALERFIANPLSVFDSYSFNNFLTGESYVPLYMMVLDYFDSHALWYGKSFLGLITAVIPSSLYAKKPPVDDGMYLYSICQGRIDIMPIMSTSSLDGSSYPLETFGSMYSNFGIIGLLFGMLLLGIVYGSIYRKMVKRNYTLFWLIIYSQIMFGFELSTLRIFQLFQTIVTIWILIKVVDFFSTFRKREPQ